MDCLEAIAGRQSIRQYKAEPVAEQDLIKILEAGRTAPSAGNLQPCYFVVVRDSSTRAKLQEAALGQEHIIKAPVVIVVCVDPERSSHYGDIGRNRLCLLDAANATENMLLAAYALGYGSCWTGGFSNSRVKKLLDIPEAFQVVSLITIGKAEGTEERRTHRPLEEVVRWDKW